MPAPHVTAFRHIFVPGNSYLFLLDGTNIDSPQGVNFLEANTSVAWTTNSWTFDGQFLEVTATLALAPVPPVGTGVAPTGTAPIDGDGSLTIVVTNGPDTPGGSATSDNNPPIVAAYYTSSS